MFTPEQLEHLRRHSKLRLDREARFWLDGRLVENERVQVLFHRGLSIDPASGDLKLTVGEQWAYIETVDDTGWFVTRAELRPNECVLTLADESQALLAPETLSMTSDTDMYCVLSGHRRARFLRTALIDLAPGIEETRHGLGLRVGTRVYEIRIESH